MLEVIVKAGDLFNEEADVIVVPANPWLNMSGGVNGAILSRGGEQVQAELHAHLRDLGKSAVEAGTVVVWKSAHSERKNYFTPLQSIPFTIPALN